MASTSKKDKSGKKISYQLNSDTLEVANGHEIQLKNVDECMELFDFYFPEFESNITTLPQLAGISGGVLYGDSKESGYKGEVFDFYCGCIEKLEQSHGLLIHGYSDLCTRKVIHASPKEKESKSFEIDWVYFNNDKLVVIEVGRKFDSNLSNNNIVSSKIKQMVERSKPEAKHIVEIVLNSMGFKGNIDEFMKTKVEYLICLTNNKIDDIQHCFEETEETESSLAELVNKGEFNNNLYFMTKETVESMNDCKPQEAFLYQFCTKTKKIQTTLMFNQFFLNKPETIESSQAIKYLASVFSISKMMLEMDPSENPRFIVDQENYCFAKHREECKIESGRKSDHKNCEDFYYKFGVQFEQDQRKKAEEKHRQECKKRIHNKCEERLQSLYDRTVLVLSPQQLNIMKRNPKYAYLYGEAGTGKTTMLLVKLLQCCGLAYWNGKCDEMKTVTFLIPKTKVLFTEYIQTFISKHCHEAFANVLDPENLQNQGQSEVHLVDELYGESDSENYFRKHSWIQATSVWVAQNLGGVHNLYDIKTKHFAFETIPLTTLFRSASPISNTATIILDSCIRKGKLGNDAELLGLAEPSYCFGNNQSCINLEIADSLGQAKKNWESFGSSKKSQVKVFVIGYDEDETKTVLADSCDLSFLSTDLITKSTVSPLVYPFSGVEFDDVVLVFGAQTLHNLELDDLSCIQLCYNVMTRSVNSFTLCIAKSLTKHIKPLIELVEQPQNVRLLLKTRSGKKLSEQEKKDWIKLINEDQIKIAHFIKLVKLMKSSPNRFYWEDLQTKPFIDDMLSNKNFEWGFPLLLKFLISTNAFVETELSDTGMDDQTELSDTGMNDPLLPLFLEGIFLKDFPKDPKFLFYVIVHGSVNVREILIKHVGSSMTALEFKLFLSEQAELFFCIVWFNDRREEKEESLQRHLTEVISLYKSEGLFSTDLLIDTIRKAVCSASSINMVDLLFSAFSEDERHSIATHKYYLGSSADRSNEKHYNLMELAVCNTERSDVMCRWVLEVFQRCKVDEIAVADALTTALFGAITVTNVDCVKFFVDELHLDLFDFDGDFWLWWFDDCDWRTKSYLFGKVHEYYQNGQHEQVPRVLKLKMACLFGPVWDQLETEMVFNSKSKQFEVMVISK